MRYFVTFLVCLYVTPVHAVELQTPIIKQLQGMVVVHGSRGFISASKGMKLEIGDEIRTGRFGKVYIDFPDRSRVKLGVRSRFIIQKWQISDRIFTSTLRILKGAFRYTAGVLQSTLRQRRTTFKTNTAVLGVRGTDFWGRVEEGNTFFLLLEGSVEVSQPFEKPTFYDKEGYAINIRSGGISTPKTLSTKDIATLSAETEITLNVMPNTR